MVDQQQANTGVFHDIGHVIRPVIGVDRYRDQAKTLSGNLEHDPLAAVTHAYRYAVTGIEAFCRHARVPEHNLVGHLLPADVFPFFRLRIELTIGAMTGAAAYTFMKQTEYGTGLIRMNDVFLMPGYGQCMVVFNACVHQHGSLLDEFSPPLIRCETFTVMARELL